MTKYNLATVGVRNTQVMDRRKLIRARYESESTADADLPNPEEVVQNPNQETTEQNLESNPDPIIPCIPSRSEVNLVLDLSRPSTSRLPSNYDIINYGAGTSAMSYNQSSVLASSPSQTEQQNIERNEETVAPTIIKNTTPTRIKQREEAKVQKYICVVCNLEIATRPGIIDHSHPGVQLHICGYCNRSFRTASDLKSHLKLHAEDKKKFNCTKCNRNLSTACSLESHTRIHTGIRPFVCQLCEATFLRKGALRSHETAHGFPYHCDKCIQIFKTHSELIEHKNKNKKYKLFECKYCGRGYNYRSSLLTHEKTHTGMDKKLQCDYCGSMFQFRSRLIAHIKRVHTYDRSETS